MIYRIFVISLFAVTASFFIPKSASASEICSVSKEASGNLVTNTKVNSLTTTSGGSPTKVLVTCSQPVNLTVSAPIQVSGIEFKPVSAFSTVTTPFGTSTKSGETPLALPVGTTPLLVDLSVDKGSPLRPGQYNFIVRFNFAP